MKKGLKLFCKHCKVTASLTSRKTIPDEKGIETETKYTLPLPFFSRKTIPDEKGIETFVPKHNPLATYLCPVERLFLMKKGLKHLRMRQEPRRVECPISRKTIPDEKGIETMSCTPEVCPPL